MKNDIFKDIELARRVTLFYVLYISLISLHRNEEDYYISCCIQSIATCRYVVGKRKSILIIFSCKCGKSYFSEMSILQSVGLSCTLNVSFPHA